jgi:23S rRNA pseudouridine1911/1915/1917 synthase
VSPETYRFTVPDDARGERLDRFLGERIQDASRERVKKAVRAGACLVDGRTCPSPSFRLAPGMELVLTLAREDALRPESGELTVLYSDETLAVLDKPAGLSVHPCPSCPENTLVHRLAAHFPQLARMGGLRPGIVHRLDKDTSGLMVVALEEASRLALAQSFARREVRKEYLALVRGIPSPACGDIHAAVGRDPVRKTKMAVLPETRGGKSAHSRYEVLYADPKNRFSLLNVRIFTGRTHQIRVHLASVGHPILGDALYGPGKAGDSAPRQMLHAHRLAFRRPADDKEFAFHSPPPPDFLQTAKTLSRRLLPVVLTGMPASGKSSLMRLLEEAGLPCFNADEAVHRLYAPGGDGRLCLLRRFGERFVPDAQSPVDRRALSAAVREDPSLLPEVEEMIHPLIIHEVRQFWATAEARGEEAAVAEIPLYFESGQWKYGSAFRVPPVIGVRCEEEERRRRRAAREMNTELQEILETRHWPAERKLAACDMVIDNSGRPEELREQARQISARLRELREREEQELAARLTALWS